MIDIELKKKISAYTTLAGGIQEAEAQIVYVDLPDPQICTSVGTTNNPSTEGYLWSNRFFFLDMDGKNYSTFGQGTPSAGPTYWTATVLPNRNPNADVLFLAPAYAENNATCYDSAWAWGYAADVASWGGYDKFMGTSVNGYIKNLDLGENIGPGVPRATANWGIIPAIGYYGTCMSDPAKITYIYGDPNWIDGLPLNQKRGYIGIAFDIGGNTHYGWIQIEIEQELELSPGVVNSDIRARSCITILDYAYNTVPDLPILAGQRPVAIPTLSQWGLICLNLLLLIFGLVAIKQHGNWILRKKTRQTAGLQ